MTVLFAVTSPLQVLNAHFYITQNSIVPAHCHVLLFTARNENANSQSLDLLAKFGFEHVTQVRGAPFEQEPVWGAGEIDDPNSRLEATWTFRDGLVESLSEALADVGPSVSQFVMGDYRPLAYRQVARFLSGDRAAVLLDDGSITPEVMRYRHNPRSSEVLTEEVARFRHLPFDRIGKEDPFTAWDPRSLTFFSIYSGEIGSEDRLLRNTGFRNTNVAGLERLDECWIIGCNHVEANLTTFRDYLTVMRQIAEFFGKSKIVYQPHRGEDFAKIQMFSRLFDFEVRANERPIELSIIEDKVIPANIVSIGSSAIDNLVEMKIAGRCRVLVAVPDEQYFKDGRRSEHLKRIIKRNIERVGAENTISVGSSVENILSQVTSKQGRLRPTGRGDDVPEREVVWATELDLEKSSTQSRSFKLRPPKSGDNGKQLFAVEEERGAERYVTLISLTSEQINGTIYLKYLVRPVVNYAAIIKLVHTGEKQTVESIAVDFGVTDTFVHLGAAIHCIGSVTVVDDIWFKVDIIVRLISPGGLDIRLAPVEQRSDRATDNKFRTRYSLKQASSADLTSRSECINSKLSDRDELVLNYDLKKEMTGEFLVRVNDQNVVLRIISVSQIVAKAIQQKKVRATDAMKAIAGWRSVRVGEFRRGRCSVDRSPIPEIVIPVDGLADDAAYVRRSVPVTVVIENGGVTIGIDGQRWNILSDLEAEPVSVRAWKDSADGGMQLVAGTVMRRRPKANKTPMAPALCFPLPNGIR